MPLSLAMKEEKPTAVDTCTVYVVAQDEAFQERMGLVRTPRAPFTGVYNVGT